MILLIHFVSQIHSFNIGNTIKKTNKQTCFSSKHKCSWFSIEEARKKGRNETIFMFFIVKAYPKYLLQVTFPDIYLFSIHNSQNGLLFPSSCPDSKESACNAGDQVWSLGQDDPIEKEMSTHSAILAWRIPWTEKPVWLQSMGLQKLRHNWATNTHTIFKIYLKIQLPI